MSRADGWPCLTGRMRGPSPNDSGITSWNCICDNLASHHVTSHQKRAAGTLSLCSWRLRQCSELSTSLESISSRDAHDGEAWLQCYICLKKKKKKGLKNYFGFPFCKEMLTLFRGQVAKSKYTNRSFKSVGLMESSSALERAGLP